MKAIKRRENEAYMQVEERKAKDYALIFLGFPFDPTVVGYREEGERKTCARFHSIDFMSLCFLCFSYTKKERKML